MERNKKYILKGAGVLLIAVTLIFTSIAVTANTMDEKQDAISLTEVSVESKKVNSDYGQSGMQDLWDNGLPDGRNGVSCVNWPSYPLDRQIIDDFTVPAGGWTICDGHFRIVTYSGAGPEIIDAVIVFFYKSTGPCEPDYELYAELQTTFNAYLTGDTYFSRPEIAVDCDFECIDLAEGEWWVCFQPVMEDNSFWLTTVESECSIFAWFPDDPAVPQWTWGFDVFGDYYDVSFKLTGAEEPVPAICCDGVNLQFGKVGPGTTVSGEIVVTNCGEPGSYLNWKVDLATLPNWGNWTFAPESGTGLAEGDFVTISVDCEVTDVLGTYSGDITIFNSDDSTDYCKVPTSVEVPRARSQNILFWNLLEQFPVLYHIIKIIFGA